MRVVILGGYGVFGRRLAQLLRRDGHDVWIAGRNSVKAARTARRYDCQALRVDRRGDLSVLLEPAPDIIVDAAGPFQHYGQNPYRLVEFCIENKINYADLSDDGAFTAGVAAFDAAAKAAGCFALSGASSVPGLSSAVVDELSGDMDGIDTIEAAIMPGNRAPRGRSVIASILGQAGAPLCLWRGGAWREGRAWSEKRTYELGATLRRTAWTIGAPDVVLFPDRHKAKSVIFRAGMELGVMNAAVSAFSWLRRNRLVRPHALLMNIAHGLSTVLKPFGSDRGGMIVRVIGEKDGETEAREWRLVAEAGEGPFIPAVPIRALLRKAAAIDPGARPCLSECGLLELDAAMADLTVSTQHTRRNIQSLFQASLGAAWRDLPRPLKDLHSVQDINVFSGCAKITRGRGVLENLIAACFHFPNATDDAPVRVAVQRTSKGETWVRNFDGKRFRSYLSSSPKPGHVRERFSAFSFDLHLPVKDGALHYNVAGGRFFGLPAPKFLLAKSVTREYAADGVFHFDVALYAPVTGGLIVRYQGALTPDAENLSPQTGPASG